VRTFLAHLSFALPGTRPAMLRAVLLSTAVLCALPAAAFEPPIEATPVAAAALTTIDAASIERAIALRDAAMERNEAWMLLESLTTEVGPRMAGSASDAAAVEWAQRAFKGLGYDKVWTEPVTFPVWERRRESAEIVAPFPQKLVLAALGGSIGTGGPIEAEVIEFSTLAALKEARAEDVRGKIVFIGNRMTRARDGGGYGPAVAARVEGASAAAALGAKALLIRSIGTSNNRIPHTGTAASLGELLRDPATAATLARTRPNKLPIPATPIPAAALSNPDADLLARVLERSRPVRLRLDLDVGWRKTDYTSANVIGELTGSERPDEVVLIGGHLDSWDLGTGAIDNGAGVAITMAAGHVIARSGPRPRRSIRVVAFANEEQGIYGGRAYAEQWKGAVEKHVIGAESDFGYGRIWRLDSAVQPGALPAIDQIMQVLAPIGVARGLPYAYGGADLGAMRAAGMAIVGLQQDGTTYFDYHHTPNDTLDKVDVKDLNQNVAVYAVFAFLAAQAEGSFGSKAAAPPAPAPARTR
jgi:hypothetical protein